MHKREIQKRMAAAGIVGRVSGSGEAWEVEVADEKAKGDFVAFVADVKAVRSFAGWTLRPMEQAGLMFGTLDSAEQTKLF